MAPIDPVQLLKALSPLLSVDGGIADMGKAPQFANLMKKFSKKLVSRCVYCNVLRSTEPEILSRFLEDGGWLTINMWLKDAKENDNKPFILEILNLCKILPMTVERLKENNTPKFVKTLTKYDHEEIKSVSNELVVRWMTLVKNDNEPEVVEKKSKVKENDKEKKKVEAPKKPAKVKPKETPIPKKKTSRDEESVADGANKKKLKKPLPLKIEKFSKESPKTKAKQPPKRAEKLKGTKRHSNDKAMLAERNYEDVKIDPPTEPSIKRPKIDRPKTVKSYQAKFRTTGLEQEVPLPKKVTKKFSLPEKNMAISMLPRIPKKVNSERIMEKKIKPESLMNVNNSNANPPGGIKLIPAKPKPTYVLQESSSFMDALIAAPLPVLRRKKKPLPKPTTPPSPTMKAPKLQFYKDTLEVEEAENKTKVPDDASPKESPLSPTIKDDDPSAKKTGNSAEASPPEVLDTEVKDESEMPKDKPENIDNTEGNAVEEEETRDPNTLVSILAHNKRRKKKKSVQWVADNELKQIRYFELDETERVNVLRGSSFGDLRSIETMRERKDLEAAKRKTGDNMEESIPWWPIPILIDVPTLLCIPGCGSEEKKTQFIREQSVLQEIYFSKDTVPDTAQEPDTELMSPHEPRIIPLNEDNSVGQLMDFTSTEFNQQKPSLPPVLQSLMRSTQPILPQLGISPQIPLDLNAIKHTVGSPTSPYDPGEPVSPALLPSPNISQIFANPQQPMLEPDNRQGVNPWGAGPTDHNIRPPDMFFSGFPMNPQMMMDNRLPMPQPGSDNPPRMRMAPPPRIFRPNMGRGGSYPNRPNGPPRGPRRTVVCRHFAAGACRFGSNCVFLHPGVNGPL